MKDYEWQKTAFDKWDKNGRTGIIEAVPGAGKTHAGVRILEQLPNAKKTILCPTKQIMAQWEEQTDHMDNVEIYTYFGGAKLAKEGYSTDVLVCDECHSVLSPKRRESLGITYKWILGLSATPKTSHKLIGDVFVKVGWDEANISDFEITYVKFPMTMEQHNKHELLSRDVRSAYKKHEEGLMKYEKYMAIIMKRRSFIYNLTQRVKIATDFVKKHKDSRIMVFSERLDQVDDCFCELISEGIGASIYTSRADTLGSFVSGDVNCLVTSKMVKEGFDDPKTSIGIIVSTPLTRGNHIQTIGRIIRNFPNKMAKIYVILADGTNDVKLIGNGGMPGKVWDLGDDSIKDIDFSKELKPGMEYDGYYAGEIYHIDYKGKIFKKGNDRRKYIVNDKGFYNIRAIMMRLKQGGMMKIDDHGNVLTTVGKKLIYLGKMDKNFIPEFEEEKEMTNDELYEKLGW